jgi:hypothetical protein
MTFNFLVLSRILVFTPFYFEWRILSGLTGTCCVWLIESHFPLTIIQPQWLNPISGVAPSGAARHNPAPQPPGHWGSSERRWQRGSVKLFQQILEFLGITLASSAGIFVGYSLRIGHGSDLPDSRRDACGGGQCSRPPLWMGMIRGSSQV